MEVAAGELTTLIAGVGYNESDVDRICILYEPIIGYLVSLFTSRLHYV